ncbi:PhzF family phenazine biosynthesis protein [Phytohabitans flavus]|uniref:Phenazine antibiotic biosynthesis-like protein n=1 Tax=Phytohabitans flavus TaxID=1076124 RepID=A0A6F8Y239_9ACTN|nr:phenazine antibiotic biosynthesis-like protein [Phytohabitans flavus]
MDYQIVDVFTDRAFTGNPLAVVFGAQALSTDQLQAIAREFNLSETVFVLPPTDPAAATYRARIFTPKVELPFAGHPSVGAAVVQAGGPGRVIQECGAGLLPIEVAADGRATLTGGVPSVGPEIDPAPLLAVAGLAAADFVGPPPRMAGCGIDFPYLAVHPDAVARAVPNHSAAARERVDSVTIVAWDAATSTAHVRMFAPGVGVAEDPATGSAALGLGVWLVTSGLLAGEGESAYSVRQGAEIHRPSILDCTVTAAGGVAVKATVTGQVVPVADGRINVP